MRSMTKRFTFPLCRPVLAVALLAAAVAAPAQMLADPALEALYQADRPAELQRSAQQRLASQPDDAQAVLALALVALERNDAALRRDALERARGCAERQPRAQPCHYAHGTLLGVQAMNEGMLAAARSAGTVREALGIAHTLDPAWYPARGALLEFYALAPGMMGGSSRKAAELAQSAPRPEQAAALQARLLLGERKPREALALLLPLLPVAEPVLRADVVGWGSQAALGLVNDGQPAQAQAWFERLMRDHADESSGPYGLARVKGELGDWAAALALLERAGRLKGAQRWPVGYRTGIAQQQLGQRDAARASLQRFVDAGKGQKASLDDARKRLAELAAP
jgi:tetratricopeptide (TPR) repeat protein